MYRQLRIITWVIAAATLVFLPGSDVVTTAHSTTVSYSLGPLGVKKAEISPAAFTRNEGQWDERVLYRTAVGDATIWLTKEGVYYEFLRRRAHNDDIERVRRQGPDIAREGASRQVDNSERDSIEVITIRAQLIGGNKEASAIGLELLDYKCNYFHGNDQAKWRTNVANYRAVVLESVYNGIDVRYYFNSERKLEYDFIAAPGADLSQIKLAFDGVDSITIDDAGRLVLSAAWVEVREDRPIASQTKGNGELKIDANYVLGDTQTIGFSFARDPDASKAVLIDPVLSYSTYLGGSHSDIGGIDIAVDRSGCAYITGTTRSADFPVVDPYQAVFSGDHDVYVSKLAADGGALEFSTYLGGSDKEQATAIAIDNADGVYVVGTTWSPDFPVESAFQPVFGGFYDAFVAKLSPEGDVLAYSSFLGGELWEGILGVDIDGDGDAYVTGRTASPDFPLKSPYQDSRYGPEDAFVAKILPNGSALMFSTYLGGDGSETGNDIVVDPQGNSYVTGKTDSPNYPTQHPYQGTRPGGESAFLTKLDASGKDLVYSTYFGGSKPDWGARIDVDKTGCAYVCGTTWSADFPLQNPIQSLHGGGWDTFVAKFNAAGNAPLFSTFLGGSGDDYSDGIAIDATGRAFVTGETRSPDFPVVDAFQPSPPGVDDAYVTVLDAFGRSLVFSTYLGGSDIDWSGGIALEDFGNAYVSGMTASADFPVMNPYQGTPSGREDAFVCKFALECNCAHQCDYDEDGLVTNLDLAVTIDILFSGSADVLDPSCSAMRSDFDCDGFTTPLDLAGLIDHLFVLGNPPCDPCAP